MALSQNQIKKARDELDSCKNPLFLYDDDQDGLCSFLQMYRYKQEGKGVIVKTLPKIGTLFLRHVEEYHPDKIFVLDIADIEQEFIDSAKVPVIWIDHHGPYQRENVKYFNPRLEGNDNFPTSFLCHQITNKKEDLWIAAIGCIADWFIPPFLDEFMKEYPDIIDNSFKEVGDIIFNTKLGKIIRVLSFILKGRTSEVQRCIRALAKMKSPYEILNGDTENGKMIYKRYSDANKEFEPLLKDMLKEAAKSKDLVFFKYPHDSTSFTSDLGNEAIYRFPEKVVIIAREKGDELKCSIRSSKINLKPIVEKSVSGLEGYGGGHEHACGLNIKTRDFPVFLERFRKHLNF